MSAAGIGLPPDNQPVGSDLIQLKPLSYELGGWCPYSIIAQCGYNSAALALNATTGHQYMPTCAGTPTGVPQAYTGRAAFVYDTTANRIWVYNGSWRSTAALT